MFMQSCHKRIVLFIVSPQNGHIENFTGIFNIVFVSLAVLDKII